MYDCIEFDSCMAVVARLHVVFQKLLLCWDFQAQQSLEFKNENKQQQQKGIH